jgi:hypothetical protein
MQSNEPQSPREDPPSSDYEDERFHVRRVFIDETPASMQGAVLGSLRAYWQLWLILIAIAILSNWQYIVNLVDPVPLEYRVNPFPVMQRQLKPGETLTTLTYRCNNTKAPITYITQRRWVRVDDEAQTPAIPILDVTVTAQPGCVRAFSRRNAVPEDLPSGVWIIEGNAILQGRFREFHIAYETDPFEVLP